jgi:hypothetical protein
MADYVNDGKIGVDLTAVYASTSAGSPNLMPAKPGDVVDTTNNGRYVFARCASDTAQFDCVVFGPFGDSASTSPTISFVPATTTNVAAQGYNQIGFCQNSVASSYYTWVLLNGQPRVNVLIAAQPKVPLYTTATAGKLDDTTVSAGYVTGVVLNTSATSASAPYATASWPKVITSNPV